MSKLGGMGGQRIAQPRGETQGMRPSGRTRGPTDDTLQRMLPFVMENLGPEVIFRSKTRQIVETPVWGLLQGGGPVCFVLEVV